MINYVSLVSAINEVVKNPEKVRIHGDYIYIEDVNFTIPTSSMIKESNEQEVLESMICHLFYAHQIQHLLSQDKRKIFVVFKDKLLSNSVGILNPYLGTIDCLSNSGLVEQELIVQELTLGDDARTASVTVQAVDVGAAGGRRVVHYVRHIHIPKGNIITSTYTAITDPVPWMDQCTSKTDLEAHPGNTLIHKYLPKPGIEYQSDNLYITDKSTFIRVQNHWIKVSNTQIEQKSIVIPQEVHDEYKIYLNAK